MKEICILTQWQDRIGGQQKIVSTIANHLSNNGDYKITICTLDKNKIYYDINKNIKVDYKYDLSNKKRNIIQRAFGYCIIKGFIYIKNFRLLKAIYYPNKRVKKLNQYLLDRKFDIVIGVAAELSMLLCLTDNKCKKIGWQHSSFDAYYKTKGRYVYGQENLFRHLLKNLDINIVLNKDDKTNYNKIMNVNSIIIHNAITIVPKKTRGLNDSTLIFVGRLVKYNKGLDYLAEILEQLYKLNNNFKCLIVGGGADEDYINEEIQVRGLANNVTLIGKTQDVVRYYTKASILLSTSRWEGFGLTLLEAMSCGVIPISFENSGSKEIIDDNINGYIIDDFNINKYVETINHLLHDSIKRKELSTKAIEKSKQFDTNSILDQWKKIL